MKKGVEVLLVSSDIMKFPECTMRMSTNGVLCIMRGDYTVHFYAEGTWLEARNTGSPCSLVSEV